MAKNVLECITKKHRGLNSREEVLYLSLFLQYKLPLEFTLDLYISLFKNVVMIYSHDSKHNAFLSELIFL